MYRYELFCISFYKPGSRKQTVNDNFNAKKNVVNHKTLPKHTNKKKNSKKLGRISCVCERECVSEQKKKNFGLHS